MTGGRAFKLASRRPSRFAVPRARRLARLCVAATIASLAMLSAAASASAQSDSMTITVGSPTIVAGGSTIVTVSGDISSADGPANLLVYYGPTASFSCSSAPPENGDNYSTLVLNGSSFLGAGPFDQSAKVSATLAASYQPAFYGIVNGPPGSYVFCGYLIGANVNDSGQTLASGSATMGIRLPHDSLELPRAFRISHGHYSLRFGYQLEPGSTSVTMYLAVYPKYRIHGESFGCHATPALEYKYDLHPPSGWVTMPTPVSSRGSYGVCAILFDPDQAFKLATASSTIVGRPYPHRRR